MERSLKLSEKLFCLAVNPKNGGFLLGPSSVLAMTVTGSVFVELMDKELISMNDKRVHVQSSVPQNDEIHDFFLNHLKLREKDRKLRTWISYFNMRGRKIQKHFIRVLVRKNVLRTEERRILFIPYEEVFVSDRELVEKIRQEVENTFMGKGIATDQSLILALMVAKTNLLPRIFAERAQRREARQFLKTLPETPVSKAVQEAIQMMHAAVFAAAT